LEFRYEPLEPSLTATVLEWPTAGRPYFVISIAVQNLEGIERYRLWLENDQGSAPIRGTEVTFAAREALRVPVSGVRSGGYVVRVQALNRSDRILVESAELRVAYQAPGAIARLVASLQGSTVAVLGMCGLGVLAAVGLGALGWYLVPRGKGVRNVELVLPEKARRAPRPVEPASPPVEPLVQARAAPAPAHAAPAQPEPARAQPPRPAPAPAHPAVVQPAAAPKVSGILAVVSVTEPVIVRFQTEIRKSPFRIGRAADNDGVLPVDATSGVSGHHCVITVADGRWYVQDDKSKFGTTVNGQPIPKGEPFRLEDGALLGLGPKLRIQLRIVSRLAQGTPS
ncbi:MAG TPA: FHA domain-containing protein, partial [Gemmatimonadales bacterium]